MESQDYSSKLRSPKWQRRRLEIMSRDNFKCRLCGDTEKTLNVHHKYYLKGLQPWEYADEDLITLCEDCHEEVETLKIRDIKIQDIRTVRRWSGCGPNDDMILEAIVCQDYVKLRTRWKSGEIISNISMTSQIIPDIIDVLKKSINNE